VGDMWRLSVPGRTPARRVVFVVLVLLLAAAVGAGATLLFVRGLGASPPAATSGLRPGAATPDGGAATLPAPPPVLAALAPAGPAPGPAAVAARLAGPLHDRRLGPQVFAAVVDLTTGATLYDSGGSRPAAPASTTKLTTAAAALASYPADHRFATRVLAGAHPGEVVLVGGGDLTLSAAPSGRPTVYPGAARLADLAAAVRHSGAPASRVVVDGSLFGGPAIGSGWDPRDVAGGYIAPITALMTDAGRLPGTTARSPQPDVDAGRAFARMLGLRTGAVTRGRAPAAARVLGEVWSAPLARIVESTLLPSDNVLAEMLARQVALARHAPATFAGAVASVRAVLAGLGVDVAGDRLTDGSGLSTADRLSPALLVSLLRVAASAQHPELHPLFAGLPVGGYDGTLDDRYRAGPAAAAAGAVRAKTGTLTGVSSLAGVVQTAGGRLLAFAFLADRSPGAHNAEAALDAAAAALIPVG
jgi:serine-type D-Ala-D-Ala carboxypeptidase/endopeptidase (penicillin-binding protein 4)